MAWLGVGGIIGRAGASLASFPGLPRGGGGGERKAWYTLHAHAR